MGCLLPLLLLYDNELKPLSSVYPNIHSQSIIAIRIAILKSLSDNMWDLIPFMNHIESQFTNKKNDMAKFYNILLDTGSGVHLQSSKEPCVGLK